MSQVRFITGVNATVDIGGGQLEGASFVMAVHTDYLPADQLGTRFKQYGIGQTGATMIIRAPQETNADPNDTIQNGDTGPVTLTKEDGITATWSQAGIEDIRSIVDAGGVSQWEIQLRAMGDFEDFGNNTDADGRDLGPNE